MKKTVFLRGQPIGEVSLFTENGREMLEFACPFEGGFVYKLHARMEESGFPLGVLIHQRGDFVYKRPLNKRKLGDGCQNVEYFYIERHKIGSKATPPLDFSIDDFEAMTEKIETSDHALQNCLNQGGIKGCTYNNERYLCCRLNGVPFALAPFFCLVTVVESGDTCWGVIKLDDENIPTFLNKPAQNRAK